MRQFALFAVLLALPLASASAQEGEHRPTWEHPRVERMAWPALGQFESEREFRNWVRDVRNVQRDVRDELRRASFEEHGIVVAQANVTYLPCDPDDEECLEWERDQRIVVTGSRVQSANLASVTPIASITNNQTANVDEGDIVKRIGDYLVVLQDGRIFAANFRTMQLADRIDVYRTEDGYPVGADWYDEMLVLDDHIIIAAYSYEDEASELSVFRLDTATGRLERRGVFLISSEDYYDSSNYATRLVGDRLIIYTPFEPEDLVNRRNRPVVRRWVPDEDFDDDERGEPMLEAENIYRPVFGNFEPMVHVISVCDLGSFEDDNLDCKSTGFVGGQEAEMFVSPDNVFLWTSATSYDDYDAFWDCDEGLPTDPVPSVVYRMPLGRAEPDLLSTRGFILNQFSMQQQGSRFRALLSWPSVPCVEDTDLEVPVPHGMELVDNSIGSFVGEYRAAPDRRFTQLPSLGLGRGENRFIGDWLVYGARRDSGRPADLEEGESVVYTNLVTVPLLAPENASVVPLGHEVTRLESLGNAAVVTGYLDTSGLNVTHVALGDTARITDSIKLEGRYESESRSHAFSAMPYPEGDGLMGLPTVRADGDNRRYPWYSLDSQLSFMRFDSAGHLSDLGAVDPTEIAEDEIHYLYQGGRSWTVYPNGYRCEVSCVDWYGNSRPIFIDRGVYALMGTELVEARALDDRVEVLRRLDLTGALPE